MRRADSAGYEQGSRSATPQRDCSQRNDPATTHDPIILGWADGANAHSGCWQRAQATNSADATAGCAKIAQQGIPLGGM